MIKQIQKRFITIAMLSMIIVLSTILAVINFANYQQINQRADDILKILIDNDGSFPKVDKFKPNTHFSPETPFDTRFFSVFLDEDGDVYASNTGNIAAISSQQAISFAQEIYEAGDNDGFIDNYKFKVAPKEDGLLIVFLDYSKELTTFENFLKSSIILAAFGILAVFILVYFLSKIAIKPISESYDKQKRFITDASHEIKTPLTIIQANTEMLQTIYGQSKYINSSLKQINRLNSLTNKLLALSKMDESSKQTPFNRVDFSSILTEAISNFEILASSKNILITSNITKQIPINGDFNSIIELVNILLENAIKYSPSDGVIDIVLKKQNHKSVLVIKNDTNQMAIGNHNELLERFYRMDDSRSKLTGGFGLGLAMAQAIVFKHHGTINVYCDRPNTLSIKIII